MTARSTNVSTSAGPSRPSGAGGPPARSRSAVIWAWEWTKSIVVALVVWFFLRTFLVEAFRIPSGSMENTLLIG
ncbi:MAG: S26 family signal peptidase, partial [Gemmatimonadales bacterium]